MAKVHLQIVTPEKEFFNGQVDMVIAKGVEGDFAILRGRAPIATPLEIGKLRIKQDGVERIAAICGGYLTALDNEVTIVTDSAEWPEEIDVERAMEAKKRAEARLNGKDPNIDVARAEAALRRAMNRLEVSKDKK
ncbi:MAG: F0F1 ATP synthase subunit epsilon [Tissierellia bacterium]|nr:F0F1 ATP synthase subunit epsilon [Tissierellia bacterium]